MAQSKSKTNRIPTTIATVLSVADHFAAALLSAGIFLVISLISG